MPAKLPTNSTTPTAPQPPPLSACESSEPLSLSELLLFGPRQLVVLEPARHVSAIVAPAFCSALLHGTLLFVLAWYVAAEPIQRAQPFELVISATDDQEQVAPPVRLQADASDQPLQSARRAVAQAAAQPANPRISMAAPLLDDFNASAAGRERAAQAKAMYVGNLVSYGGPSAEFFGISAYGDRFVFVLDVSGSMGEGDRFRRAATELIDTIEGLTADQSFCVLLFSNGVQTLGQVPPSDAQFHPADETVKERIHAWLGSVVPAGWSDPRAALQRALQLQPSAIFLLSDGEFKTGPPLRRMGATTLRLARANNPAKVPIHTIAYEDPVNRHTLRAMSRTSGGTSRFVPRAK